jgi:hypothetical protein
MQSAVKRLEGQTRSGQEFQVETPASRKLVPYGKNVSPFCLICYAAKSQTPRNVPVNVFSDKNGFLWHCQRPECKNAIWNLDRDYITGCRSCRDLYETDHEVRAAMDQIAGLPVRGGS